MKKILAIVLCVLMIGALAVTAFAAADDTKVTVTADKTVVKPGDTVKVTVSVTGTDPFTAMGYVTNHDGAYFTIVESGAALKKCMNADVLEAPAAPMICTFSKNEGLAVAGYVDYETEQDIAVTLDGVILSFSIKIKDDAPAGQFTVTKVANFNNGATPVKFVVDEPTLEIACDHTYGAWTEDGDSHKQACTKCGKENTAAHTWNAGEVTKPADCKNDGVKTFTCTVCSATKTEAVEATGAHNYTNGVKADEDNHTLTCTGCGDTKPEAHKLDNGTVTVKPTCKDTGVKTVKCTACDYSRDETVAKTEDHTYGAWQAVEGKDEHKKTCSVCGKEETAAHAFGEGEITKEPTCKETGVETFKCADCGATKEEVLPVTEDHIADEWTKVDADTHKGTCSVCEKEVTVSHFYYPEFTETEHWGVCNCGEKLEAEAHEMVWDYDEELHVQYCDAMCGYHTEIVEHKWDEGTVTKKPTATAEGEKTFKCECGATKTEAVAKITTPATGDNNANVALVVLAVLATCGLALTVIGKKRFAR